MAKQLSLSSQEKKRAERMKLLLKKEKTAEKKVKSLEKSLKVQKKKKAKAKKDMMKAKKIASKAKKSKTPLHVKKARAKIRICKKDANKLSKELQKEAPHIADSLAMTPYQLQKLTKHRYKVLREEVNKTLDKIRRYSNRC